MTSKARVDVGGASQGQQVGAEGPIAYVDVGAVAQHRGRGIGRYISSLVGGFRSIGALGSLVTTDPRDRATVPVVHVPAVTNASSDLAAPGQVLVATVYDLTPVRFPFDVFRPWQLGRVREYVNQLRVLRQSNHLIAISESTAGDVARFLRLPRSSMTVIVPGVDRSFADVSRLEGDVVRPKRLLAVGAASRHKNLPRLLKAHAQLEDDEAELVIVGLITARQADRLRRIAAGLGTADRLVIRIKVSDDELRAHYAGADLLVLPSLWEGFGLPVAEAMAAGVPVVCSDRSSLPEVVGSCARLVDPTSVADLSRAIDTVLSRPDVAADMAACGKARAPMFDWEEAASRHLDVYRAVVRQS